MGWDDYLFAATTTSVLEGRDNDGISLTLLTMQIRNFLADPRSGNGMEHADKIRAEHEKMRAIGALGLARLSPSMCTACINMSYLVAT